MATQYTKVTPDEFNSARTQVVSVLGVSTTGTPGAIQGYGQSVASSAVGQYQKVTEADLDNLRADIVKTRIHQTGSAPTITDVSKDDKLTSVLFNSYSTLATATVTNKDTVAANQVDSVVKISNTETYAAYEGVAGTGGGWKNNAGHTVTVNFDSANDARYFFNAGGALIFSASRTGGTVAPGIGLNQNTSWTTLLNTVTTEAPTFDRPDFYALTNTFSTFYNKNATGTYAANYYRISAKSNVANNSQGGATQIEFKIDFIDAYNDGNTVGYDGVDGTLTSTIVEKSTKGVANGGAITVPKPFSYSSSPATGFSESGTPIYITASYTVTASPTSVTENSATVNFTFNATNYNTGNTVTFTIISSTTTGLSDFVQTGWTQGSDTVEGYKTLTKTATNTGTFSSSSCSVSIVTNPDALTEGPETFTIEATGTGDGSGGGFPTSSTFTVTDSSKTPTPGGTLSAANTTAICVIGEGFDTINTTSFGVTSTPLTGNASLILYGLYLDLTASNPTSIDSYKLTLPGPVEISPGQSYYTFPTPVTLAPTATYTVTAQISSNSGPAGTFSGTLRVRTNGGSADGSGPNTTAPSYNTFSATSNNLQVQAPMVTMRISSSSYGVDMSFAQGEVAQTSIVITIKNDSNARVTLSGYSVSSSNAGLSVTFSNLNNASLLKQGSITDTINLASQTAGNYFLTATVTGTNPYAPVSTVSRSDILVSVVKRNPEISVSVTSVSSVVNRTTPTITATCTNTGDAPLKINSAVVGLGSFQDSLVFITELSATYPVTVQPGSSLTSTFKLRRKRIGSSLVSFTVNSNAVTNPIFTATGTVTTSASTPKVTVASFDGGVVTASETTNFSTTYKIKKLSQIFVNFLDLGDIKGSPQITNADKHTVVGQWESGNFHQYVIEAGVTSVIGGFANPNLLAQGAQTGEFEYLAWAGNISQETEFWKTGVGILWCALKNGVFDNGIQSYHTIPGRMGDGVNQSTNQIKLEIEIIPRPTL
ncbi:hypothetical protein EBU71_01290, partial [bacterium]|nr:hypothetical protein [Candidatus Elulimicrobium humile]